MPAPTTARRRRLAPTLILVVVTAILGWTWLAHVAPTQSKVLATGGTLVLGFGLFLGWILFRSGYSCATRAAILAAGPVAAAAAMTLVEYRGVSGDLVPQFGWRFEAPIAAVAPVATEVESEARRVGEDYAQFLGPGRDARMEHVELELDWDKYPPKLLWRRPVGLGWSAFAVRGSDAVTQEQDGADEAVVCYDLLSGDERWRFRVPARFESGLAGDGPRATPTVTADRIYTIGATGILSCLARSTGDLLWQHDLIAENEGALLDWGWSSSPLLVDGLVVVNVGGSSERSMVAYDATDGSLRWSAGSEGHSFSSPQVSTLDDVPQIVTLNWGAITGRAIADGALLWSFPWADQQPSVAQPVVFDGNLVAISAGYGIGAELHRVERDAAGTWGVERIWKSRHMKSKFSGFFATKNALFGLDDGILASVDIATGRRNWKGPRYGHGQMILVKGHLIVLTESGDITLVATDAVEFREVARIHALDGKSWNCPTLATPYLLVRNDEEAACYALTLAQ